MATKTQIPKRITVQYLRSLQACPRGIRAFRRLFGESAAFNVENAKKLLAWTTRDSCTAGKAFADWFIYTVRHDRYQAIDRAWRKSGGYYDLVSRELLRLARVTANRKGK